MRILLTIPHFYQTSGSSAHGRRHGSLLGNREARLSALRSCIHAIHQLYGPAQFAMQIVHGRTRPANQQLTAEVHVIICTTGHAHLLPDLAVDPLLYHQHPTQAEPPMLGFECQAVLRDRWGNYDYYCYLEDDLILHDPWLFLKLAWFNRELGGRKLLLPNRFERGSHRLVSKAYIDGDLAERVTAAYRDGSAVPLRSSTLGVPLVFHRALNPHSGCFFLNAEQMALWTSQPHFLDRSTSFIGPLESAATLGILRTFEIYKPARENASFLEIEHYGSAFLSQLRRPEPAADSL